MRILTRFLKPWVMQGALLLALSLSVNAKLHAQIQTQIEAQIEAPVLAPDWLLADQHGQTLSFYEDSAGMASVMLFWTPTCADTCRQTLESLLTFSQQHPIKVYLLTTGPLWRQPSLAHFAGRLPQLENAHAVARFYGVSDIPKLLMVNPRKEIVLRQLLSDDSTEAHDVINRLSRLLDAEQPPKQDKAQSVRPNPS